MFFDYHLHSHFSSDSEMSLDEICTTAINKGLTEIAITDHYDLDYQDDQIEFLFNKNNYLREIDNLQKEYSNLLTIKRGIELGMQPHLCKRCTAFIGNDFDYVIASIHTAERKDLYQGDFFIGYQQWEAYQKYLIEMYQIIDSYNNFSVIGHLDVVRRYGDYGTAPDLVDDPEARTIIEEILKILIKKEKGLEVNTSGYYIGNGADPLPSRKILKLYHELGGEIITLGSDSHYTQQIAFRFQETVQLLKEIGFQYLTTFDKMKPTFHSLDNLN